MRVVTGKRLLAALVAVLAVSFVHIQERVQARQSYSATKFGIFYLGWHCPVSGSQPSDISRALASQQSWGGLNEFHWWSKPEDGYYCLSANDTLLAKHAVQLRDAGIDFIFYDATNFEYYDPTNNPMTGSARDTLERLVDVWSGISGAPKVALWVPITTGGDMVDELIDVMDNAPADMWFRHDSKPLIISVDGPWTTDASRVSSMSSTYTMRRMWSFRAQEGAPSHYWSYMEQCASGFKASNGTIDCDQRYSVRSGTSTIETVPVAAAHQAYQLMSDTSNAVPKFYGRTFWRQFKRAYSLVPELVLITGWNEWVAQRGCTDRGTPPSYYAGTNSTTCPGGTYSTMSDGQMVFADQYTVEYNRDIEPAYDASAMGNMYYTLMKRCVLSYKAGALCPQPVPLGYFDSITGSAVNGTVDGWTFDLESPATAIGVHAYFYPPSGSPTVVTGTTTVTRSDVNSAYGITGTHGFSIPVPKALYNGTTYTVRIYGIDHHDPTGYSNAEIGASPRTFNYTNQAPVGNNDGNVNSDGNVHGWAYDPNHPGESQVIHVQYYNTTTWALVTTVVTSTNQLRTDVNSAYGITGNHGFTTRHCTGAQLYASAYAFDLNSGSPTSIGGQYIAACSP